MFLIVIPLGESMTFNDLMAIKGFTTYSLSKNCSIPKTTLFDIASSKTDLLECTGRTLLSLSKALGVKIEYLLKLEKDNIKQYPAFLAAAINNVRGSFREKSSVIKIYIDQLLYCINIASEKELISNEEADALKKRYTTEMKVK